MKTSHEHLLNSPTKTQRIASLLEFFSAKRGEVLSFTQEISIIWNITYSILLAPQIASLRIDELEVVAGRTVSRND
jgi:hypothetical protein